MKKYLRSNAGISFADLIGAISVVILFVGAISAVMYNSHVVNLQIKVTEVAVGYSVEILEYIDKVTYEEIDENFINMIHEEFNISDSYNVEIEITNYTDYNPSYDDLIKIVNVSVTYEFEGRLEGIKVDKIKVKEIIE